MPAKSRIKMELLTTSQHLRQASFQAQWQAKASFVTSRSLDSRHQMPHSSLALLLDHLRQIIPLRRKHFLSRLASNVVSSSPIKLRTTPTPPFEARECHLNSGGVFTAWCKFQVMDLGWRERMAAENQTKNPARRSICRRVCLFKGNRCTARVGDLGSRFLAEHGGPPNPQLGDRN